MTVAAVIYADSFGSESLSSYATTGTYTFNATGGRGGRSALVLGSSSSVTITPDGVAHTLWIAGVALNPSSQFGEIDLLDAGGIKRLEFRDTGVVAVNNGATVVGTVAQPPSGVFTYVAIRAYFDASAGTVDIWYNETNVLSATGLATGAAPIKVQYNTTNASSETLCDLIIQGSGTSGQTPVGDRAVIYLPPSGAGGNAAWTPTGTPRVTNNTNPSGNLKVVTGGTETIVPGGDLTLNSGTTAALSWDLWVSDYDPGFTKQVTCRVRRDNIAGSILASTVLTGFSDQVTGHAQEWASTYADGSLTDGHYVLTVQETSATPAAAQIWSDTRAFAVETNGSANNWSASADIPPDNDTSYVSSSTATQKDSYALTDLPAGVGAITAVVAKWVMRKTDAGSRTVAPLWRISASNYEGTPQTMGTSYAQAFQVYSVSPATSSAWTASEINGAELGVELDA